MNKVWGETEKKWIAEKASELKDSELALQLSGILNRKVTVQSVRKQRQKLGITKARGRGVCKVVSSSSANVAVAVPVAQPTVKDPVAEAVAAAIEDATKV